MSNGNRPDWAPEGYGYFGPEDDAPVTAAEALTMVIAEQEDITQTWIAGIRAACERMEGSKRDVMLKLRKAILEGCDQIDGCTARAKIVANHVRGAFLEVEYGAQAADKRAAQESAEQTAEGGT